MRKRGKFTRAGEIANERLIEAVIDPGRYPEGTTFIAADQDGFGSILAEAVGDHRPLAIVYSDGHEIIAAPRGGVFGFFENLLTRDHEIKQGQLAVALPSDYRIEIRNPQALEA